MRECLFLSINIFIACLGPLSLSAQAPDKIDTLSASVVVANDDRLLLSGLTLYDGETLRSGVSALGVSDIVRTLKSLSGVASGMEMTSGLYVHGGDGSDNLFLLDGVPLFQVAHLGGIYSSFNTEAIRSLDFYQSGFPAQYGGRASSVVDITTKEGDNLHHHGTASMGLLDGHLTIGGPIIDNNLTYFAALRRSWPDILLTPALSIYNSGRDKKTFGSYYLYDMNVNIAWTPGTEDKVSFRYYRGRDKFRYSFSSLDKFYGKEIYLEESYRKIGMDWGNLALSTEWKHHFSKYAPFRVLAYYSRGSSDIGYDTKEYGMKGEELQTRSFSGRDVGDVLLVGVEIGQTLYLDNHRVGIGADYQCTKYLHPDFQETSRTISFFADDKYSNGPWNILVGLRLDACQTVDDSFFIPQPRLMARYSWGTSFSVNTTYTRTAQFSHLLTSIFLDLPTNRWAPSSKMLPATDVNQFTVGFRFYPSSSLSINGELYYKYMDNLVLYASGTTLFPSADDSNGDYVCGDGRAYGMGLEGKYRAGHHETSVYYTLSWSQRLFPSLYPYWYFDRYDNRHKLTLRHSWQISKGIGLDLNWDYHSGNRITLPEQILEGAGSSIKLLYSSPNNMRMPAWHRLDVGLRVQHRTKRGHEGTWSFGLYNVYCRKNPLLQLLEDSEYNPGCYSLKRYSLPPMIPSVSYLIKF